ncbi:MucR family transcriptional regulator [Mesorhizobium sp. SP-1A]|uniref:MucR family transcriptional regulator n=1 Tax=Mesorhizobium sp. SP-1A TaxID=3077840 RepID=UPI0028F6F261|nr:MucR family transcriptional regulator [Mesorhizobium sp. SP-1A]
MAGLHIGSWNLKPTNQQVVGATLRFLDAYKSRNNVSDDSLASLSMEILSKADNAFELANRASDSSGAVVDAAETEFRRFLASEGITVSRVTPVQAPSAAPVSIRPRDISPAPVIAEPTVQPAPRPRGRARKLRPMINGHELPRNVTSLEETISMKSIVCLEDGRKVKDLAAHLKSFNMTPAQYREKWGLSASYPMHAPLMILQRGATFDVDYTTGTRRRVRI